MQKWLIFFLLLYGSTFVVVADEPKFYWGVMAGVTEFSVAGEDINPMSLTGRFGYDFGRFLSIEARLMASDTDSFSANFPGYTTWEINYLGNVSAKLNIPFGVEKRVNLYGLVGYSTWKWTATEGNLTEHDTDNGASYGIGFDLFADRVNGINIEVIRYLDSSIGSEDYTLDAASIGYIRRF